MESIYSYGIYFCALQGSFFSISNASYLKFGSILDYKYYCIVLTSIE